ncbi:MAG: phosphodiesterase [Oscillospiraceae bacterium]|nr:phosphodiesterase [Oscillospiraceae bacterium]
MKYLIASDLHGSAKYCRQLFQRIQAEQPDALLLLGDELYHGPRNDLPEEYNTKQVTALLNECTLPITAVRGNCDAEVDQMVLTFPIMADSCVVKNGSVEVFATHGHLFGEENPPAFNGGGILLCGHTHVPACRQHEGFLYLNPGSVSIPKENSPHSYMIWDETGFTWKDVSTGEAYLSHPLV